MVILKCNRSFPVRLAFVPLLFFFKKKMVFGGKMV